MQNRSASDTYLQKMSVKCAECTKNTRAHLSNARVCLRCFLLVAVSSTALRRIGDSLFRNNKKIGILFDADKVSIRIYCRHAGRAASHTKIKDRIALIRVTPDEPLTQRHGFLCAVCRAFLLISGKCQYTRWKSLGAVVAFCLVFALTPPTIEIVGFLGGAARFITKPCLKQRVMRFPTVRYGCSV